MDDSLEIYESRIRLGLLLVGVVVSTLAGLIMTGACIGLLIGFLGHAPTTFVRRVRLAEVMCHRCQTRASLPLDAIRRPGDTPLWKLEASLKCRSCRKGRYAPPVHMIKLTKEREIAPYAWVHPDDDR